MGLIIFHEMSPRDSLMANCHKITETVNWLERSPTRIVFTQLSSAVLFKFLVFQMRRLFGGGTLSKIITFVNDTIKQMLTKKIMKYTLQTEKHCNTNVRINF